jgi:hypothetical protein
MDVVYLVREGERNEELRHSLRSLVNLPHDAVWIVGHRPAWVDSAEVFHIPTTQGQEVAAKHENTWRAWWAMAEARGISDDFVLMNDDFFIMQPMTGITSEHAGPLLEWVDAMGNIRTTARMRHTIAALAARGRGPAPLLAYETHSPMTLNRRALAEVMAFGQAYRNRTLSGPLCKRSLYGNYVGLPAVLAPDLKVRDNISVPTGAAIISTSDTTFNYGRVGLHVRRAFSEPSPYERVRPVMPVR